MPAHTTDDGPVKDARATFDRCVAQWTEETVITSSGTDLIAHPAYQRIMALGPQALPWLLAELEERPNHWFWALQCLAGHDPVQAGDTFDQAVQRWLTWGSSGELR